MKIKVDYENKLPIEKDLIGDFDLFINGFNDCEKIKYGKELSGQSQTLKGLCALSAKFSKPVISAFDTDNYGVLKKSVGVFEKGKLLGICDASQIIENFDYLPGSSCKLYDLSVGKIGIAVQDDLFSFNLFKSLAVCGAEIIICLTDFSKKEIQSILIRAYSFLLGMPIILTYKGGCFVSDVKGNLNKKTDGEIYQVLPNFEFVLKTTKTRIRK
ncbi:MAG: hypothetical protein IJW64_00325 [Clostridia bacterium]|nr:hypothetical protein [Clostridia bacterium]